MSDGDHQPCGTRQFEFTGVCFQATAVTAGQEVSMYAVQLLQKVLPCMATAVSSSLQQ